ncbi:MAG: Ppx/GppA phosphatase family protein [Corynebacterium sp.]|nr:Ppx/GppA phosphatase family protein [Corynebacterium sp.]
MSRVAAVDCGTNSLRLLIADRSEDQTHNIARINNIIRLGEGVDETGMISSAAIERARNVLAHYVDLMEREGVHNVRMVATSATRDASNRDEFFAMTAELLGRIQPGAQAEVISGEEEAILSFIVATRDVPHRSDPACVIDLGGGSTEFVVGIPETGELAGAYSTQMGCVRLTERFLHTQPPTEEEIAAARQWTRDQIARMLEEVPMDTARTVVGCSGTFTTLSAVAQGLEEYDAQQIHMSQLRASGLHVLTGRLLRQTPAQREESPVISHGRADVLGGGAIIVEEILDLLAEGPGLDHLYISEQDILDGIVASL